MGSLAFPVHSGIGFETACLFASEGCSSILADINLEAAQKAQKRVQAKYPESKSIAIKCDVSKESEVEACVQLALKEFGRLDIMVRLPSIIFRDS